MAGVMWLASSWSGRTENPECLAVLKNLAIEGRCSSPQRRAADSFVCSVYARMFFACMVANRLQPGSAELQNSCKVQQPFRPLRCRDA